ncbi:MAG: hypothetical protein ABW190_16535 [Rhizobacter sp.]
MEDITLSLGKLNLTQMVCAWAFVACYALALGGMFGPTGSQRAAGLAALSAVLFCVFADYWVHGALLVLFAVAGMGVFVAVAWALARLAGWFVQSGERVDTPTPAPAVRAKPQPFGGMLRALLWH